MTSQTQQTDI